ncbi:hypothetical protein C7C46_27780 [Streptomyces tateyamensis]|uniref:Uncharacterized protein n=1 Tax=Streptomyces tateyamensis TaxID=565073 RepID=A0A2V4N6N6_9ACTN|nr:hypothetical protein [Streptomyces tateyamensis]PYC69769.1 hypothetical protein C7C46_27780 [Streptomyces tateyamensis]
MNPVRELPTRLVGTALLVAALDPVARSGARPLELVLLVPALGFAWWAAPPVPPRRGMEAHRPHHQLARHRNTVLAVVAVALGALHQPSALLAVALTVLLLGYLLMVDARGAAHVPLGPLPLLAAAGASLLVLLAALVPWQSTSGARLPAALGIGLAALAVGAGLYERRGRE